MSEIDVVPLVTFKTLTNTELGACSVALSEDGSIILRDVVKRVTESMLTSYPRSQLGLWTPNRAALRYTREEIAGRDVKRFDSGEALDLEAVLSLAS